MTMTDTYARIRDRRGFDRPVRWGMVGIGKLADSAIAPAIASSVQCELTAVCSRDAERATRFADRHGAKAAFDDLDAMLAEPAVEAVYISSPNAMHFAQASAALRAGKHVLVDKPMALTAQEGTELVAAAASAGVLLGVGFQLRHKPTNVAARDAIAAGAIGDVAHFQMLVGAGKGLFPFHTWRSDRRLSGGGTLLNQGTHAFDLIEFVSGSRIVEVVALAGSEVLDGGVEEVFVASCRLADGALAAITCDQVLGGTSRDWTVVGTDGWLDVRGGLGTAPDDDLVLVKGGERTSLARSPRGAYAQEIDDFAADVRGGDPYSGTGADGLRSIELVEALYRSAREGCRVSTA